MGNCKIVYNDEVLIDLSEDSVTPETLDEGVTAHDKDGNPIVGTRSPGEATPPAEPVTEELNITENGTYEPDDGVDGFSKVVVNVPDVPAVVEELNVTENGTYEPGTGVDGFSKVVVNVADGGGSDEFMALLTNTLETLDNSVVTSIRDRACHSATKLVTVNLPAATNIGTYAFMNCTGLKTVNCPLAKSIPLQCFYDCKKLERADFGEAASIAMLSLNNTTSLAELILRKTDAICMLVDVNALGNSGIANGLGYVYVPAALADAYKSDTKWSEYADRIRAIEDYPDITGG